MCCFNYTILIKQSKTLSSAHFTITSCPSVSLNSTQLRFYNIHFNFLNIKPEDLNKMLVNVRLMLDFVTQCFIDYTITNGVVQPLKNEEKRREINVINGERVHVLLHTPTFHFQKSHYIVDELYLIRWEIFILNKLFCKSPGLRHGAGGTPRFKNIVTLTFYSHFQMILVAIFSDTGFFDYCAVKVSLFIYLKKSLYIYI